MNKKTICTSILTLLLLSAMSIAQERTNQSLYVAKNHFEAVFSKEHFKDINYSYIEGSAYINKNYIPAQVIYKNEKKLGEYQVRYNAFLDQMETPNEKGGVAALRKVDYLSIKLINDTWRLLNYKGNSGTVEQSYFIEKIASNNCGLYLRKFKTLKDGEEAKTSFHQGSATKFVDHSEYYLKLGQDPLKKVKLRKNKVLGSFPTHADKLKDFAKNKKLDLSTESGLVQLVHYYNTLENPSS